MSTPLSDFLPHRPPMLLLEEVRDFSGAEATVLGSVRADNPFLASDGRLDPLAHAELLAQASAGLFGMQARAAGAVGQVRGMLVGVRDLVIEGVLRADSPLRVVVRSGPRHQALAVCSGEVWSGEARVATGELRLFLDEKALPAPRGVPELERRGSIFPIFGRWGERHEGASASFTVGPELPAFAGHFPNLPLFPAVAIAMVAVETARESSGFGSLCELSYAKFSKPVLPGDRLEVRCTLKGAGSFAASVTVGPRRELAADLVFGLRARE
jgi:3-hydroxymyristoyl/3-hydroxydecanoyl-(acyl carrier protein) dehydratase